MGIKKGDLVEIVGSAEESKYKGCIFTVTSDPYTIPSGPEIVKMECPEINKRFGGGYSTEFLRVVKEISIQNESNVEAAIEKIEELRSAGSLEHSDYGYLHDLLAGIDVQSAPRYSPVKPEEITDGKYLVSATVRGGQVRITVGDYLVYSAPVDDFLRDGGEIFSEVAE